MKNEIIERLIKQGHITFAEGLMLADTVEQTNSPIAYPNPDYYSGKPWWGIIPPPEFIYPSVTRTTTGEGNFTIFTTIN